MEDFNQLYTDYNEAFKKGHNDGQSQAKKQTSEQLILQAQVFAKQFGQQLAMYETFIQVFRDSVKSDAQKLIKKLHSSIVQLKIQQLDKKIKQTLQKHFNKEKINTELQYSIQLLQYDRKDLKSKFQTILSILGMKDYEKNILKSTGQKKQQQNITKQQAENFSSQKQNDLQF